MSAQKPSFESGSFSSELVSPWSLSCRSLDSWSAVFLQVMDVHLPLAQLLVSSSAQ